MCKQAFKLLLIPILLFYVIPVNANEKEEKAWSEELVYYIVVDRFNNGNPHNDRKDVNPQNPSAYHGGDIEGIIKKLDYIKDMGFTSIVLSPIFAAQDYAGEHVEDIKKVEEHFGSLNDLKSLVDEAHKREMNIILEFVIEHKGTNQQDTGKDLIDAAKWWKKESEIDGYYINKADSMNTDFWNEFQTEIEKKNENFYLIGSLEDNQNETMSTYLQSGFDSILNEHFFEEASQMFSKVDQSFAKVTKVVENSSDSLSTFIDNKNTVRFTRKSIENQQHPGNRFKIAFSYMYTVPGTPIVFYGSEIAVDGGNPPENRPLMNFHSDDELINYIGKLATIRKSLPALTKGDYQVLYEKAGMIIFKRSFQDETIVIAINNTSASQKMTIPAAEIANNKELQGLITGNTFQEENGKYEFIIDREQTEVFEIKDKKGLNIPLISVFILVPLLFILFLVAAKKRGQRKNS